MKFEEIYTTPSGRPRASPGRPSARRSDQVTFDTSPARRQPRIMWAICGSRGAVWEKPRPDDERRAPRLQNSANYFGEKRGPQPERDRGVQLVRRDVGTADCPVAVLAPGTLIEFGTALRTPSGHPLGLARDSTYGTET